MSNYFTSKNSSLHMLDDESLLIQSKGFETPKFSIKHLILRFIAGVLSHLSLKPAFIISRIILDYLVAERSEDIFSILLLGYVEESLGHCDNARACYLYVYSQVNSDFQAISLQEYKNKNTIVLPSQYDLACFNLGFIADRNNDNVEALRYFRQSIEINPNNGRSLLGVGKVYEKMGDLENAYLAYEKMVAPKPKNETGWVTLGRFCHQHQKIDRLKEVMVILHQSFPKAASKLAHELLCKDAIKMQ